MSRPCCLEIPIRISGHDQCRQRCPPFNLDPALNPFKESSPLQSSRNAPRVDETGSPVRMKSRLAPRLSDSRIASDKVIDVPFSPQPLPLAGRIGSI